MAAHVLERPVRVSRRSERPALALARHLDLLLVCSSLVLTAVGIVMVYSATRDYYPAEPSYFLKRQIVYAVIGLVAMVFCAAVDYRRLEEWAYLLYGVVIFLLVVVRVAGQHANGSERWLSVAGFQFQPSEFAVLAVIATLALYLTRYRTALNLRRVVALVAMTGLPMLLVVVQPDLGTALLLSAVLFVMLYFGGVRFRFLIALLAIAAVGFACAVSIHLLSSYQLDRITSFLHQNSGSRSGGYNLLQSKTAIGSGGLEGTGLFKGEETNLSYVPAQYADFIFSAIGEQLGFIGSAVVLLVYGIVVFRIFRAIQVARDSLGRLLCAGVLAFVVFSVFENVGMATGIMPITGIPLPLISYGGSALIAFFMGIGLVMNVELRRQRSL